MFIRFDDKLATPQSHESGFDFVTHLHKDLSFPVPTNPKPFSRLTRRGKRPVCLGFRSSEGFITFVGACLRMVELPSSHYLLTACRPYISRLRHLRRSVW